MQKEGLLDMTADWGVTPHAQKTGTSPCFTSTASPKSGHSNADMPICSGFPIWMGDPCTRGYFEVISTALMASDGGNGLIETTILPWNRPADAQGMFVLYMGTVRSGPDSMWRIFRPLRMSASSKENEHPIRKVTRSGRQKSLISCTSWVRTPSTYILYLGRSVRISIILIDFLPSALDVELSIFPADTATSARKIYSPSSRTANRGQDFGFLWQKRRKSKAYSRGSMHKFACTNPAAKLEVWPTKFPSRQACLNLCEASEVLSSIPNLTAIFELSGPKLSLFVYYIEKNYISILTCVKSWMRACFFLGEKSGLGQRFKALQKDEAVHYLKLFFVEIISLPLFQHRLQRKGVAIEIFICSSWPMYILDDTRPRLTMRVCTRKSTRYVTFVI